MSLAEAATVTSLGSGVPNPDSRNQTFLTVILILLWVAAAGALVLLPAIFVALEKAGVTTVGGRSGLRISSALVARPLRWRTWSTMPSSWSAPATRGEARIQ